MSKKAVMLVNLGTPKTPIKKDVKAYLRIFLSDPRVIKTPDILWQPILHMLVLPERPQKSAKLYQSIWRKDGSPLLIYAKKQQAFLQERLPGIVVEIAMSYSHPRIFETLNQLLAQGIDNLTVIPLYPQYSGTTVGSIFDEVMRFFIKSDKIIDLHFVHSFCDHPAYISYYADKIKKQLNKTPVDALLFSYHGIPLSYQEDGDPYAKECLRTTETIMQKIGDIPFYQTFQSRFGSKEWLKPATDVIMKNLPHRGVKKIMVVTPGFVADCLETLVEIEIENKAYFMENGGKVFEYIRPFNDDEKFAELLADLVKR